MNALAHALLCAALSAGPSPGPNVAPLEPEACTLGGFLAQARRSLSRASPAYRKYLRELIKDMAIELPAEALTGALLDERDPELIELLGAALATRASFDERPELVQPLLARARKDADPLSRAAAVRAMRATGSVEVMEKNGSVVTYADLLRDESPEVRRAAVDNLIAESTEVYGGHDRTVAEEAVRAAASTRDGQAAAAVLKGVSMEQLGDEGVSTLERLVRSDDASVRAAAAIALGGVPGTSSARVRDGLLSRYREERDPTVRAAILEALARLGQGRAVDWLRMLRGVAPELDREIDAWVRVLGLGLQEWEVILREKRRQQS